MMIISQSLIEQIGAQLFKSKAEKNLKQEFFRHDYHYIVCK